jgi:hypothetical protein
MTFQEHLYEIARTRLTELGNSTKPVDQNIVRLNQFIVDSFEAGYDVKFKITKTSSEEGELFN